MKKYEHDVALAKQYTERFNALIGLCKTALVMGTLLACAWLFIGGLVQIATSGNSPEALQAIGGIVEKFSLDRIASYIVSILTSGAWLLERGGKKRAIREKGLLQEFVERNDPGRTTSGLTPTGDSPKVVT